MATNKKMTARKTSETCHAKGPQKQLLKMSFYVAITAGQPRVSIKQSHRLTQYMPTEAVLRCVVSAAGMITVQ